LAPRHLPRNIPTPAGGRDGSSADGLSPKMSPGYLRGGRDESPASSSGLSKFAAGDPRGTRTREEASPAADGASSGPGTNTGAPGKYRPPAFRAARGGQ
jgi:hypothetical protein